MELRCSVWAVTPHRGGAGALAQDLCLWPLTRGFLPVPPLCQVLSQMWWLLPGGMRQGTGLTHCAIGRGGRSPPPWGHPGGRDGAVESEKGGVSLTRRDPTGRKGTQGSAGTPRSLIFVIKAVGTVDIFEQGRFGVRAVTKRSPWFLCVGRIRGKWEAEGVEIWRPWQGYDGRGLVWRWAELYWPLDQPVGSWDAHLTLMALRWRLGWESSWLQKSVDPGSVPRPRWVLSPLWTRTGLAGGTQLSYPLLALALALQASSCWFRLFSRVGCQPSSPAGRWSLSLPAFRQLRPLITGAPSAAHRASAVGRPRGWQSGRWG